MKISKEKALQLAKEYNINLKVVPLKEWIIGLKTETEHSNVIKGDFKVLIKIVIAHLEEDPRYYKYLAQIERKRKGRSVDIFL